LQFLPWAAVFLGGIAGGAVICAALVVPTRSLTWTALAGFFVAIATVAGCWAVFADSHRADAAIASAFIALGACMGGYALAAALSPGLMRSRSAKAAIAPAPADHGIAVVLLADAEPESYDPWAVTHDLDLFESAGVPLPPEVARPVIYASERSRYRRAGGSPARAAVHAVSEALAARLLADGTAHDVRTAFCLGAPSLEETLGALAAAGWTEVVVACLTVAWTRAFESAVTDASSITDMRTEVTDPMWPSPHIAAMAAQRALATIASDPANGGVVLVSEGEPREQDHGAPEATEQTTFFAHRVRAALVDAGLEGDKIRRAWLQWEEPDVSEAARHLAALGAHRIALLPVTFPTETIATLMDLRYAAERASEDTGATVIALKAWGDDPAVIEALAEAVETAARRLREEPSEH
jgi:protoheme ferro-lyase